MKKSEILKKLADDGYCVVPDILLEKECDETITGLWDWLKGLDTGIRRNKPETWKNSNWPFTQRGCIQHLQVGHIQPVWNIRQHPNVVKVFKKIHNTDELLVSFDGINIMRPPELMGNRKPLKKAWLHTDQSPNNKSFCIQGLVNLEKSGNKDGSLLVIKGSHKYHKKFFKHKEISDLKIDWYKLSNNDIKWFTDKKLEIIKVNAPKGSMILWDSKTIHCNAYSENNRKNHRFRYAIYVCMLPIENVPKKIIDQKKKAFNELRTTSHWANKCKLFPKVPRTYGATHPNYKLSSKMPTLTDVGKRLAGLKKY